MRKLPAFLAVREILDALILKLEETTEHVHLHLDIKTDKVFEEDGVMLFRIRIYSTKGVDLQELQRCGLLTNLMEILREMQKIEDECHLCVQYPDAIDSSMMVQRNFSICDESSDGNEYHLENTATMNMKQTSKICFGIHIRLYQETSHLMFESQKLHKYLQLFRIFHAEAPIQFSLRILESKCFSQFEFDNNKKFSQDSKRIVADSKYYFSEFSKLMTVKHISTDVHAKTTNESLYQITVIGMKAVRPVSREHTSGGYCIINFFGPGYIPLFSGSSCSNNLQFICENWKLPESLSVDGDLKFGGVLQQGFLSSDVGFTIVNSTQRIKSAPYLSISMKVSQYDEDLQNREQIGAFLNDLRNNDQIWRAEEVKLSLLETFLSMIDLLLQPEKNYDVFKKRKDVMNKAIVCTVQALSKIVLQSTDQDFQSQCYSMMQAEAMFDFKEMLKKRLYNIGDCFLNVQSDADETAINPDESTDSLNTTSNENDQQSSLPDDFIGMEEGQETDEDDLQGGAGKNNGSFSNDIVSNEEGTSDQYTYAPDEFNQMAEDLYFQETDADIQSGESSTLQQSAITLEDEDNVTFFSDDDNVFSEDDHLISDPNELMQLSENIEIAQTEITHKSNDNDWMDDVLLDIENWLTEE